MYPQGFSLAGFFCANVFCDCAQNLGDNIIPFKKNADPNTDTYLTISDITKQSLYSPQAAASERRIPLKSPVPKFTQNAPF